MTMVIDFIETTNRDGAAAAWKAVSAFLATREGFRAGDLLQTGKTLMPRADYPLASVCAWDAGTWEAARAAARAEPLVERALAGTDARFRGIQAELVDGGAFVFRPASGFMMLIDMIFLRPDQIEGYAAMWRDAADYMSTRPGYVNAGLYRNADASDELAFVNFAEWESEEIFFAAVHTDRFMEIVEPYKENFALYLSTRVAHQAAACPVSSLEAAE